MKTHTIKNNDRLDTLKELIRTLELRTEWLVVSTVSFYDHHDGMFTGVICYHD